MSRKPNYYNQIIDILKELHKYYPQYNMGRHLETALSDYGDVWGLSDKELLYAMNKYKSQLEIDIPHDDSVDRIIKEGMDLTNILNEEDNGDF